MAAMAQGGEAATTALCEAEVAATQIRMGASALGDAATLSEGEAMAQQRRSPGGGGWPGRRQSPAHVFIVSFVGGRDMKITSHGGGGGCKVHF
jgi:hypothetical protein